MASIDKSNGYDEIAPIFIPGRGRDPSGVGASVVAEWSQLLPPGATVLDLGCGTGIPISLTLIARGFHVHGVDASPRMTAEFRTNFATAPVQCAAAEDSDFFAGSFDAVIAWGLFFLLTEEVQLKLISKIAAALPSGGRLLFTALREPVTWLDAMTKRPSISLGFEAYRAALDAECMAVVGTYVDGGQNYYYSALKR